MELLTVVQQRGIVLAVEGGHLSIDAPLGTLTDEVRTELARQKPTLLEVLWRLTAMRRLATEAPRALAYARVNAKGGPGHCFSCGDALELAGAYGRCQPCDIAADVYYATLVVGDDKAVVA
jgi:hypothetical protein